MRRLPTTVVVAVCTLSALLWLLVLVAVADVRPWDPTECPPGVPVGRTDIAYEAVVRTWTWFPRAGITCVYPVIPSGSIVTESPLTLSVLLYLAVALSITAATLVTARLIARGALPHAD